MAKQASSGSTCYRLTVHLLSNYQYYFSAEPILRIIDVRGTDTLSDLHYALFEAFDREDDHLYEFYFGTDQPYDLTATRYSRAASMAVLSEDEKPALSPETATIDSLHLERGDVFYYLFDTGDDWWHRITVTEVNVPKVKSSRYPRLVKKIGKSPAQYEEIE